MLDNLKVQSARSQINNALKKGYVSKKKIKINIHDVGLDLLEEAEVLKLLKEYTDLSWRIRKTGHRFFTFRYTK